MATRTVAYLTPLYFDESSYIGGGERIPLNWAKGVVAASRGKFRVEMISFGPAPRRFEMAPGVALRVLTASRKPENMLDVVSWDLPEAIAGADLVHIHQAYTRCTEMGLLVAKLQHKPVVVTDHGGYTSPLGVEVGSLDLIDRIVAYSDFGASLYGRTRTPIEVIRGGVDAEVFSPRTEYGNSEHVLFIGRILPHKGVDVLIEAMPPELPLVVYGRAYNGDYFRRLQGLAEGKRVEFVLQGDDATIRSLLHRAWANILPSVYRDCDGNIHRMPELMGMTLLESMASGTPAIASRVGGMPEFIRHGETGFVYDSPEELTGQLRALAADAGLVERMGRRGREVVMAEYDLKVTGAKLVNLYERLIAGVREAAA
jgi:glycosyltransferase involved in cell wall biosynthesis